MMDRWTDFDISGGGYGHYHYNISLVCTPEKWEMYVLYTSWSLLVGIL